jgi:hypothetical protein
VTQSEYQKAYRAARVSFANLSLNSAKEIRRTYVKAADQIAERIRKEQLAGHSQVTIQSLQTIEEQLRAQAATITSVIGKNTTANIKDGVEKGAAINVKVLDDAIEQVGEGLMTKEGVQKAYVGVNAAVIASVSNRIYSSGYTLSETIWRQGEQYTKAVKDIVSQGIAMGRSSVDIAKDVQAYVKKGKQGLANRYGPNLVRGSEDDKKARAFMKRIGNTVDYNALRLIRSELYMGLQEAAVEQGHANPGCTDEYLWSMSIGHNLTGCDCEDYDGKTYAYSEVPEYPHSNCGCQIVPVLRDETEFLNDLTNWVNGDNIDYMDNWYNTVYRQYQ